MNDKILGNLNDWKSDVQYKIIELNKYSRYYRLVNMVLVTILATSTAGLGYMESMSLGVEVTNGNSDITLAFSAVKLCLIIISTIITSILTTVNPSKKAQACYKCGKDYSEILRVISSKIDKFEIGFYENEMEKYSQFVEMYGAKEKSIIEDQPIILTPFIP